jgi:hypothetical protein
MTIMGADDPSQVQQVPRVRQRVTSVKRRDTPLHGLSPGVSRSRDVRDPSIPYLRHVRDIPGKVRFAKHHRTHTQSSAGTSDAREHLSLRRSGAPL